MLTARAEESDRIVGSGAGRRRLHHQAVQPERSGRARARAAAARASRQPRRACFDTARSPWTSNGTRVLVDGSEVRLTAKEFLLLQYLLEHQGRVLSRDLLLSDVWGYSYTGGTRTVDVHVRRLREKLPLMADALITVKQFGYKLTEPSARDDPLSRQGVPGRVHRGGRCRR